MSHTAVAWTRLHECTLWSQSAWKCRMHAKLLLTCTVEITDDCVGRDPAKRSVSLCDACSALLLMSAGKTLCHEPCAVTNWVWTCRYRLTFFVSAENGACMTRCTSSTTCTKTPQAQTHHPIAALAQTKIVYMRVHKLHQAVSRAVQC